MSEERTDSDTQVTAGTIFLPILVVFLLGQTESHYSDMARSLQIPTASVIPFAPFLTLIAYWICLIIFNFGRSARHRVRIAGTVAVLIMAWPVVLVRAMSVSIQLPRWLKPAESDRLRVVFPHPYALYFATDEGTVIRIRRGDDPDSINAFIKSLPAKPPANSTP